MTEFLYIAGIDIASIANKEFVVIYRGAESPAENDSDFGIWLEVLEDDYSYLDIFDFDLDGITRGIIIEWDDPGVYGLDQN